MTHLEYRDQLEAEYQAMINKINAITEDNYRTARKSQPVVDYAKKYNQALTRPETRVKK